MEMQSMIDHTNKTMDAKYFTPLKKAFENYQIGGSSLNIKRKLNISRNSQASSLTPLSRLRTATTTHSTGINRGRTVLMPKSRQNEEFTNQTMSFIQDKCTSKNVNLQSEFSIANTFGPADNYSR